MLRRKFMRVHHLRRNLFQKQHLLQLHQLNQLVIFWWVFSFKALPDILLEFCNYCCLQMWALTGPFSMQ
jgi:hypothetical protein